MKNNIQIPRGFATDRLKKVAENCYLAELNELAATYMFLDKVTADRKVSAEFVTELNQNRRMSYTFTVDKLDCDFISGNKFLPGLKDKAIEYLFNNSVKWLSCNCADSLPNEYKNYLYGVFKKLALVEPTAEGEASVSNTEQYCGVFNLNVKELLVKVISKEVKANESVENILFPLYLPTQEEWEFGSDIEKDALTVQEDFRQSVTSRPMLQRILTKTESATLLKIDDIHNPLFIAAVFESIFRNLNTRTQVLKRFATYRL